MARYWNMEVRIKGPGPLRWEYVCDDPGAAVRDEAAHDKAGEICEIVLTPMRMSKAKYEGLAEFDGP